MKNLLKIFIVATILIFASSAAKAELMVGDKAPKLQVGKWVQGGPVQVFDTNHIYIVEFWATWCGPCIQSIPHLNQLWQKFKDKGVIVIGQDIWDSDDAVAPFVKKMGTNMTYRVALDDKSKDSDGFMSSHWWPRKINHHGIPTAFIINKDGIIAWIGHPMGLNEQILDDIVSGHYDVAKAAVDYKKNLQIDDQFQDLQGKLFSAIRQKKWNDAQAAIDDIEKLLPKFQNGFTDSRLQILLGEKKFDEAYQFADKFSNSHATNDFWQNELAWTICTSDNPNEHCLQLAQEMAERAVQLTSETNSGSLDTLARVQFMLGKKDEAVATEGKAVKVDPDAREKSDFEKTLTSYREGKLPDIKE
jgi:thiol-disulfide isomerase/thioredoxin